jgi:hypothetical protein
MCKAAINRQRSIAADANLILLPLSGQSGRTGAGGVDYLGRRLA